MIEKCLSFCGPTVKMITGAWNEERERESNVERKREIDWKEGKENEVTTSFDDFQTC